ncbi:hypothetical protein IFM89_010217 [Coptis chinensis]|uniref:Cytochrome P450 n=1 Tax=Coptis chinensis TaxID=261450 RepID=A0A835LAS0_9MAGN|nr:hypothetical protein IFM89_010217 [Coptis chinensis]
MLLQLGEVPHIVVSSPTVAKEVMKTHDVVFADRPGNLISKTLLSIDYQGVIISPYGEYWRQLKKIYVVELLSAKRVQSSWSLREEEVRNLVEEIYRMAASPVNLTKKFSSLSYDIISRTAFGKKCKEKEMFISLMKKVMELAGGFEIGDLFPSLKFLRGISGTSLELQKITQKIDTIFNDIVNEHRENRIRVKAKLGEIEEDLIDVLLRLEEENDFEFAIDNNNIKAVIFDIAIAGTDTSSTTIEWAMSEIMRNPEVMEKAQDEVRRVLNGRERVNQSDISELQYLKSVVKETLRLHPPAPLLLPRESRERCQIDRYEVPPGTRVIVNAWAMGRDPEYWSDAESFNPERFLDVSIDYKGTNFEYIPGRRICPGIMSAITNMELALAQLLFHFNWKLPNGINPEDLDMTENFGITVGRKSNLYLIPTPYSL